MAEVDNEISGYKLVENIYETRETRVWRARDLESGELVIIKVPAAAVCTPAMAEKILQEYDLGRVAMSGVDCVVRPIKLLELGTRGLGIVMKDVGSVPLSSLLSEGKPLISLQVFLEISLKIAVALGQVHERQIVSVVHRDIKPSNILIRMSDVPEKIEVLLGDFGISCYFSDVISKNSNIRSMVGTLPYMSPEATGRFKECVIDHRSDLYSLGCTLFEMATGCLPFVGSDANAIIHSHIARKPRLLTELRPDFPLVVSKIILKLLAKEKSDRYLGAYGLKEDLGRCILLLKQNIPVADWDFDIALRDIPVTIHFTGDIIGRDREVSILHEFFDQTIAFQRNSLVTLIGAPGIGKSAVVSKFLSALKRQHFEEAIELNESYADDRGMLYEIPDDDNDVFFVEGSYEQETSLSVPYCGIISALRRVIEYLVSTVDIASTAELRDKIVEKLGADVAIIADLIPNLYDILPVNLPPLAVLPPVETESRFCMTLGVFLSFLGSVGRPLVLLLDNVQWIDQSSVKLLSYLLKHPDLHIIVICCCQVSEIALSSKSLYSAKSAIPLGMNTELGYDWRFCVSSSESMRGDIVPSNVISEMGAITKLYNENNESVGIVSISPLSANDLVLLIANVLRMKKNDIRSLVEAALVKTRGSWEWNTSDVDKMPCTSNVYHTMSSRITDFSETTKQALIVAAAMGVSFRRNVIAKVLDISESQVMTDLLPAFREGLILFESSSSSFIRFVHDHIVQGCIQLADPEYLVTIHNRIGNVLLVLMETSAESDSTCNANNKFDGGSNNLSTSFVYSAVYHLNKSKIFIRSHSERLRLTLMNYWAGKKALEASAYMQAAHFLREGISLLPDNCWEISFQLAFDIYKLSSTAEFLIQNYDEASRMHDLVMKKSKSPRNMLEIYKMRLALLTNTLRYQEAMDCALTCLEIFDVLLPRHPNVIQLQEEIAVVKKALLGVLNLNDDPSTFVKNITVNDRWEFEAVMSILIELAPVAYRLGKINLYIMCPSRVVMLSLQRGHTVASSMGYSMLGFAFAAFFRDYVLGPRMGDVGLIMSEHFKTKMPIGRANLYHGLMKIWTAATLIESQSFLEKAIHYCSEAHDLSHGCMAACHCVWTKFASGDHFSRLKETFHQNYNYVSAATGEESILNSMHCVRMASALLENGNDTSSHKEEVLRKKLEGSSVPAFFKTAFYVFRMLAAHVLEEDSLASDCVIQAQSSLDASSGMIPYFEYYVVSSLVVARKATYASGVQLLPLIGFVESNANTIASWCKNSPKIFKHKHYLLLGEICRLNDDGMGALSNYEKAIQHARRHGYYQYSALANEAAFIYSKKMQMPGASVFYLNQAIDDYVKWGANFKVLKLQSALQSSGGRISNLTSSHNHIEAHRTVRSNDMDTSVMSSVTATDDSADNRGIVGPTSGFDINTVLKASEAFSGEINLDKLLARVLTIVLESAGAERGCLLLAVHCDDVVSYTVRMEGMIDDGEITQINSIPFEEFPRLCTPIVRSVISSRAVIILGDACREGAFVDAPYVRQKKPRSIMCLPVIHHDHVPAILYLENNRASNSFLPEHVSVLQLLSTQMAASIENATLYRDLSLKAQELQSKNAELCELDKMKDAFLANTSHELRTPLNGVIGMAEAIIDRLNGDGPLNSKETWYDLSLIIYSARSLTCIVSDLMDFSNIRRATLNLNIVVDSLTNAVDFAIKVCSSAIEKKIIELKNCITPDIPLIKADQRRIRQILIHLIDNGIKFSDKGVVSISASVIAGDANDSLVSVTVSDQGRGIPADKINNIWKSFNQLEDSSTREHGGTGLGLTLVKSMVGLAGGSVFASSVEGEGTEITFTVPIATAIEGPALEFLEDPKTMGPGAFPSFEKIPSLPQKSLEVNFSEEGEHPIKVVGSKPTKNVLLLNDLPITAIKSCGSHAIVDENNEEPSLNSMSSDNNEGDKSTSVSKLREKYFRRRDVPAEALQTNTDTDDMIDTSSSTKSSAGKVMTAALAKSRSAASLKASSNKVLPSALVVDDNAINLRLMKSMLGRDSFEVTLAQWGHEAVKMVLEDEKRFDIVLCDLMMPKMDGLEVTRLIRSRFSVTELPIIMVTAKNKISDLLDGFDAGVNDFVSKPFTKAEIMKRINLQLTMSSMAKNGSKDFSARLRSYPRLELGPLDVPIPPKSDDVTKFGDSLVTRDLFFISIGLGKGNSIDSFPFVDTTINITTILTVVNNALSTVGGFVLRYWSDALYAVVPTIPSSPLQILVRVRNDIRENARAFPNFSIAADIGSVRVGCIGPSDLSFWEPTAIMGVVRHVDVIRRMAETTGIDICVSKAVINADCSSLHTVDVTDQSGAVSNESVFRYIGRGVHLVPMHMGLTSNGVPCFDFHLKSESAELFSKFCDSFQNFEKFVCAFEAGDSAAVNENLDRLKPYSHDSVLDFYRSRLLLRPMAKGSRTVRSTPDSDKGSFLFLTPKVADGHCELISGSRP